MRRGRRKEIAAAEAAMSLRLSRERVIRLVQIGELIGRRDAVRGWFIDAQSVAAYARGAHDKKDRVPVERLHEDDKVLRTRTRGARHG